MKLIHTPTAFLGKDFEICHRTHNLCRVLTYKCFYVDYSDFQVCLAQQMVTKTITVLRKCQRDNFLNFLVQIGYCHVDKFHKGGGSLRYWHVKSKFAFFFKIALHIPVTLKPPKCFKAFKDRKCDFPQWMEVYFEKKCGVLSDRLQFCIQFPKWWLHYNSQ